MVDDCAALGVRALIVITAGYAEEGADGRRLQEALVEKVRGYGMRLVGPNCLGLMNTDPEIRLNASFSPIVPSGREDRPVFPERGLGAGHPGVYQAIEPGAFQVH